MLQTGTTLAAHRLSRCHTVLFLLCRKEPVRGVPLDMGMQLEVSALPLRRGGASRGMMSGQGSIAAACLARGKTSLISCNVLHALQALCSTAAATLCSTGAGTAQPAVNLRLRHVQSIITVCNEIINPTTFKCYFVITMSKSLFFKKKLWVKLGNSDKTPASCLCG